MKKKRKPAPLYGGSAQELISVTQKTLQRHVISFDEILQFIILAGQLSDYGWTSDTIREVIKQHQSNAEDDL